MEIGSEFWKTKEKEYFRDDAVFCLSGRTALGAIVKDAVCRFNIKSALLPSYCCHTMIEPFLKNGINVRFYDVYVNEYGKLAADIPSPNKDELLYIMKYFGDTDILYTGAGSSLSGWTATIEDMTHSCFSGRYESHADYQFASYRKWFAVDGAASVWSRYSQIPTVARGTYADYCRIRNYAFDLKARYIAGEHIEKETFLEAFAEAEALLSRDYDGYAARTASVADLCRFINDIDAVRSARRHNALVLINGLQGIGGIRAFADFTDTNKCPLCVPVLVEPGRRDQLRRCLIQQDIYCPIHWPLSEIHVGLSDRAKQIYQSELSLVCDQRYTEKDMNRTIEAIAMFMRGK